MQRFREEQMYRTSYRYHTTFNSCNLTMYAGEHLPLKFPDTGLTIELIKENIGGVIALQDNDFPDKFFESSK